MRAMDDILPGSLTYHCISPRASGPQKLLRDVQLEFLYLDSPEGLDRVAVWQDMLSGGEQQRLGFARMLFHSPKYAIMVSAVAATRWCVVAARAAVACRGPPLSWHAVTRRSRPRSVSCRVGLCTPGREHIGAGCGAGTRSHAEVHRQQHHMPQCRPPSHATPLPQRRHGAGRPRQLQHQGAARGCVYTQAHPLAAGWHTELTLVACSLMQAAEEEALDPALEALATGTPVPGERESKVRGQSTRHVPDHTAP